MDTPQCQPSSFWVPGGGAYWGSFWVPEGGANLGSFWVPEGGANLGSFWYPRSEIDSKSVCSPNISFQRTNEWFLLWQKPAKSPNIQWRTTQDAYAIYWQKLPAKMPKIRQKRPCGVAEAHGRGGFWGCAQPARPKSQLIINY